MTPKNELYDYQTPREIPGTHPPVLNFRKKQDEEKEEFVMYGNRPVNKKTLGNRGNINRPFIIRQ